MNNIVNTIAGSILSKDFKDCSLSELQKLAETHPYSGALQLLYAQKLKEDNSSNFNAQWQKTLLYFNNPLLLQHIVQTPFIAPVIKEEKKEIISESKEKEPAQPAPEEIKAKSDVVENEKTQDEETINIPGLKIEPLDPEKASLSFTPYHTVDYFASQGIKIGEEIKTTDKFGNQLKSFTSWLKEMRRLPESEVASKFSQFEQTRVEKMAENSLTGEDAVTDAMAQVWIKQGEAQKAIDIYKKLSLQNPAKSAFFAAKIDHLKKQI